MSVMGAELRKLPAFVERDLHVAWSYRAAFVADGIGLLTQMLLFAAVGLMVDESAIPQYGGQTATYVEFVSVGMAVGVFVSIGLGRVMTAMQHEQAQGTLESLLVTPTSPATIQLGSVAYDVIYVPLRTVIFLTAVALVFGAHYDLSGVLPATVLLLVLIPIVWGLGVAGAAGVLTLRRGAGLVTFAGTLLAISSGAYFPLETLPGWLQGLLELNPLAIALGGMRDALLGGTGWAGVGHDVLVLAPMAAAALAFGAVAFRVALRREQRLGTIGLY
jgi:ABC-2 type transport system permease protein